MAVFYSDLKNLIVNRPAAGGRKQCQNVGRAQYLGAELRANSDRAKPLSMDISYAYLDARDRSADRTSGRLPDRPTHKLRWGGLARLWRLSLSLDAQVDSGRAYQDSDTLAWGTLRDFWTVDAKLTWAVIDGLCADVGVRNLFDESWETAFGYPQEGRAAFARLKYWF